MSPSGERAAVLGLCALAGLRLFVLAAAFPLFNNVDEHVHFDLVLRYAARSVPRGLEGFSPQASRLIELYASPEYFFSEGKPVPLPPWSVPGIERTEGFRRAAAHWVSRVNHDATQPPVYYAIAASWYRLGARVGLKEGSSLYWIRFLDVFLYAALIWLSFLLVGRIYPGREDLRLGAPFLLAFFPQSAFYSITNDALSPLIGALAFYSAVEIGLGAPTTLLFCAGAGLACAAAFLTSGRLIAGCLVPFLVLYLDGLAVILSKAPAWVFWAALVLIAVVACGSELSLARPVFASPYNWFHLP